MDKAFYHSAKLMKWVRCLVVLLVMVTLTSCFHRRRGDGPPNFYVDETKVANAVPKPEPLAKYGNMRAYNVKGKRYYTMKSSKNYKAVGVASWYGTLFHAERTSSGERYDMLGMTAAHKTLPLPTYVEVTNLKNHRKIIVKVNDRGPFKPNRIIDLSYVAAKKLGMLGRGTAPVMVKAIDPHTYQRIDTNYPVGQHIYAKKDSIKPDSTQLASNHPVYLQVGCFRNKAQAEKFRRRVVALLHTPVKITRVYGKGVATTYRVKVGPLRDTASANHISGKLRERGLHSNKIVDV